MHWPLCGTSFNFVTLILYYQNVGAYLLRCHASSCIPGVSICKSMCADYPRWYFPRSHHSSGYITRKSFFFMSSEPRTRGTPNRHVVVYSTTFKVTPTYLSAREYSKLKNKAPYIFGLRAFFDGFPYRTLANHVRIDDPLEHRTQPSLPLPNGYTTATKHAVRHHVVATYRRGAMPLLSDSFFINSFRFHTCMMVHHHQAGICAPIRESPFVHSHNDASGQERFKYHFPTYNILFRRKATFEEFEKHTAQNRIRSCQERYDLFDCGEERAIAANLSSYDLRPPSLDQRLGGHTVWNIPGLWKLPRPFCAN